MTPTGESTRDEMLTSGCDFCSEFSGNTGNSFDRIYQGRPDTRILFRSTECAVLPTIGQLVEGYLLILPTKHFKALGDLRDHRLAEFIAVCRRVGKILKEQYGSYIFFEHGTRSEGVGGCGIYHAHLHAMPLARDFDPVDALKAKFSYTQFAHLSEMSNQTAGLSSYLFYRDVGARLYLFDTGPLPSQFMRKVLADALGKPDWNWRTVGREDRLLSTIERLSWQFESTQESAPAANL